MVAPEVTTPARRVVAVAEALVVEVLHHLQPEAQQVPAPEEQPEAEEWTSSGQRQEEPETAIRCRLILVVKSMLRETGFKSFYQLCSGMLK